MNGRLRFRAISLGNALLLALSLACGQGDPGDSAASEPTTPVTVAAARLAPFEVRIEALGTAHAREAVEITTSVTETIDAIHFEEGQRVEKGALLVTLTQDAEEARLAAARANLKDQQREVRQLENLVKTKAAPQDTLDERRTLLTIARQEILEAGANLQDRTIRAPFDGTLGLRHVSPGALVEPGTVITTLDDTSIIKLDFSVPAKAIETVRAGAQLVATSSALPDASFEGQVIALETRINPRDRSILARAELPNPIGAITPGMLLQVELIASRREALLIPEQALIPLQDKQFVLVVDPQHDNQVERREVAIGIRQPGVVEILSGLTPGELVIIEGLTIVRPGGRVTIKQSPEAKDPSN